MIKNSSNTRPDYDVVFIGQNKWRSTFIRYDCPPSELRAPDTNEGVDDDEDIDARGVVGPRSTAAGIGRALNAWRGPDGSDGRE